MFEIELKYGRLWLKGPDFEVSFDGYDCDRYINIMTIIRPNPGEMGYAFDSGIVRMTDELIDGLDYDGSGIEYP